MTTDKTNVRTLTEAERAKIIADHYDGENPNGYEVSNNPDLADQIVYIALYSDGKAVEHNGARDLATLVVTPELIAVGML